ncbi:COP9 signalosome complex subunit 8-like protein [Drosera capensis]
MVDFTPLTTAMSSQSFDEIASICDTLFLQSQSSSPLDWPFALHLLAHIYADDLNSARFLWKLVPGEVKEGKPEVAAVWRIGQRLWTRDYGGVYDAVRGFEWSGELRGMIAAFEDKYTRKMFQLLLAAYSTISVQDAALFLGMSEDDATKYTLQEGWLLDSTSGMLTVKKQPIVSEQKLDSGKLQRLTEYVFHLEH